METTTRAAPSALDEGRQFAGEILWMPAYALDALTLICGASHVLDMWNTVPRVLATSQNGMSGKTTLLDVIHLLGDNTWDGTGATSASIRARFNERAKPFGVVDEISMIFGTSGLRGENNDLAKVIRIGYRKNAVISMSVDRSSVSVGVFCFMAFAGLKTAVPNDIYSRCIAFNMVPKPQNVVMPRDSLDPDTEAEAITYKLALHAYMQALRPYIKKLQRGFRRPHPAFADRKDQIWRCVYLTAKAADLYDHDQWVRACEVAEENGEELPPEPHGTWTERAMDAFKVMALDSGDTPALLPAQRMLRDTARWMRETGTEFAFAADILDMLRASQDEELWDVLTDRKMARLMGEAFGESSARTIGERRARGFYAKPILAAWDKLEATFYAAQEPEEPEPSLFDDFEQLTPDTLVTQRQRTDEPANGSLLYPDCEQDEPARKKSVEDRFRIETLRSKR